MIFHRKDKLSPLSSSTAHILGETRSLSEVNRQYDVLIDHFQSQLDASLTIYLHRFRFFNINERKKQIQRLRSGLERLQNRDYQSSKEKYVALSKKLSRFISMMETDHPGSSLLTLFKQQGLYQILYQTPYYHGIPDPDLQDTVNLGFERALGSTLLLVIYAVLGSMGMPTIIMAILNGLGTGGFMYLNGLWGGLYNQRQASKNSLASLILGYDEGHYCMMKSNQRGPQAIAWGMKESTERAYLSGVVFFFTAAILTFFMPIHIWVLPVITVVTPLMIKGSHLLARTPYKRKLEHYLSNYQKKGMEAMDLSPPEKKAWSVNLKRKRYAHRAFILTMLLGLAGFICSNIFSAQLPFVFGTLLLNTVLPFTCIIPIVTLIAVSGMYLYKKKNHQINNRFKLSFEPKQLLSLGERTEEPRSLRSCLVSASNRRDISYRPLLNTGTRPQNPASFDEVDRDILSI